MKLEKKLLDKYIEGISTVNEKDILEYFLFYFLDLLNSEDRKNVIDKLEFITNYEWKNKEKFDEWTKGFLFGLVNLVKVKERDRELFLQKFKNTLKDLDFTMDEYYVLAKRWRIND